MQGLLVFLVAPLIVLGTDWHGPSQEQEPDSSPKKLALLVGIDDYPEGVGDLRGCVNDVRLVGRLLEQRFGFAPQAIEYLENEQATHERIVRAFCEHLIEGAGPGTEVLFWFSGHGSRVPDIGAVDGAEREGRDSSLVAWDSRGGDLDGAYDLVDDELRALVAELVRRRARTTVVTDACHSATGLRGADDQEVRQRGLDHGQQPFEPQRVADFWPQGIEILEDDPEASTRGYVHLAACREWQTAKELVLRQPTGLPVHHGALTFFLVDALERAEPGVSYASIAGATALRLAARFPDQTVCCEGEVDRELFGSTFMPPPPGFEASAQPGGLIRLRGGRVHGLRPESRLAIYDGFDLELLGEASILRVYSTEAHARWDGEAPAGLAERYLRAIEIERPAGQERLRIFTTEEDLSELLASDDYVELGGEQADYRLLREGTGQICFYGPGGLRSWAEREHEDPRGGSLAVRLHQRFEDELLYRALCAVDEEAGRVPIEVRFCEPNESEVRAAEARFGPDYPLASIVTEGGPQAAAGEVHVVGSSELTPALMVLEVRNLSSQRAYVMALSLTENRTRTAVWPAPNRRDPGPLEPGEVLRIPIGVYVESSWSNARPMRDRYLVVATIDQQSDFLSIDSNATTRGTPRTALPPIIARAAKADTTRGGPRSATSGELIGIGVVDLLVGRPR